MNKVVYKTVREITRSQIDYKKDYKLSSILEDIQNIGLNALEYAGIGDDKTRDKGINWVYTKLYIEFNKIPNENDSIYYETYPLDMIHFIYPRMFNARDKKGNILFKALLYCVLLNTNDRKIVLPSKANIFLNSYTNKKEMDLIMPKEINKKDTQYRESRKVHYSDIDINNHLNNIKYLDFILDLFDIELLNNIQFKSILISFNKEVRLNEEIKLYSSIDNTYFIGKANDNIVFEAEVSYVER